MNSTLKLGYGVLGALLVAALAILAVTFAFDLGVGMALLLLAVADAIIIVAAWRIARRTTKAGRREAGNEVRQDVP